jgi:hypothetical protein
MEQLSEEVLRRKYEQARSDKVQPREDVSDLLADHMEQTQKKRKKKDEKDSRSKKYKDFKF